VISCIFDTLSTDGDHTINVKKRGYVNRLKDCGSAVIVVPAEDVTPVYFDNIADFYIDRDNGNIQFWTSGADANNVGKYTLFDLDISTRVNYNSIYEILLRLITPKTTSKVSCVNNTFIQELFIMIRSETNIKEAIYV
jgi:hypothetical protein